ncbi:MAG: sialate O-acetylesterase, partial [Candidatus Methylumidiphilus sp.]
MKNLILIVSSLFLFSFGHAEVIPNCLFSNNMVLQRSASVPVWGSAKDGERVTVSFEGQKVSTTTTNGKWMIKLKPLKAGGPYTMTISGENTITITNILVGEVWICSGQSNLEWALFKCTGGEEAIANSYNPSLRICNIPHNVQMEPVDYVNAKWVLAEPTTTKFISGVGYWFMSKLQKELGVPVGFINVAFGGTVIESWLGKT